MGNPTCDDRIEELEDRCEELEKEMATVVLPTLKLLREATKLLTALVTELGSSAGLLSAAEAAELQQGIKHDKDLSRAD